MYDIMHTYAHAHTLSLNFCSTSVPSPVVMVSQTELELVSGSSLYLSCSIQPQIIVDVPTIIMPSWSTPQNHTYEVEDVHVSLNISSVVTADSGDYTCSATVVELNSSRYILNSKPAKNKTKVTVSKLLLLYRAFTFITLFCHVQNSMLK